MTAFQEALARAVENEARFDNEAHVIRLQREAAAHYKVARAAAEGLRAMALANHMEVIGSVVRFWEIAKVSQVMAAEISRIARGAWE